VLYFGRLGASVCALRLSLHVRPGSLGILVYSLRLSRQLVSAGVKMV